ncbi:MAG: HXXEE domain-containing protein [Lautropia sp.]
MTLTVLAAIFIACVLLHNVEEALLLPAWTARHPRWHPRVGASEFRFAVAILSVALVATALAAALRGPQSAAAYLVFGFVFAMAINAVFPHLAASLAVRDYMPGTATGLLLNLPVGGLLLHRALGEQWVSLRHMLWVAPAVSLALVASIPLLFSLGRRRSFAPVSDRDRGKT